VKRKKHRARPNWKAITSNGRVKRRRNKARFSQKSYLCKNWRSKSQF
jgi:hypothetical protein